jgi:hypothetical protein
VHIAEVAGSCFIFQTKGIENSEARALACVVTYGVFESEDVDELVSTLAELKVGAGIV